jgi:hypothetical protein
MPATAARAGRSVSRRALVRAPPLGPGRGASFCAAPHPQTLGWVAFGFGSRGVHPRTMACCPRPPPTSSIRGGGRGRGRQAGGAWCHSRRCFHGARGRVPRASSGPAAMRRAAKRPPREGPRLRFGNRVRSRPAWNRWGDAWRFGGGVAVRTSEAVRRSRRLWGAPSWRGRSRRLPKVGRHGPLPGARPPGRTRDASGRGAREGAGSVSVWRTPGDWTAATRERRGAGPGGPGGASGPQCVGRGGRQGRQGFGCCRAVPWSPRRTDPRGAPRTVPSDRRARRERAAPQGCVNVRYAAERDERTATARVGWCLSLVLFHKGFYH